MSQKKGGGTDLKDKSKSKNKIKRPKKYKCVMYNDDYTPMDFVVVILQTVFRKSSAEANALMLRVHNQGKGVAGVYSREIAEMKCSKCKHYAIAMGVPFLVEMEEE